MQIASRESDAWLWARVPIEVCGVRRKREEVKHRCFALEHNVLAVVGKIFTILMCRDLNCITKLI